jgi:hypothetical protein
MVKNLPIKGKGLKVIETTYSNGDPNYVIATSDDWRVAELHFLDSDSKIHQARCIAMLIEDAAKIGYEQGLQSIRVALGMK